MGFLKKHKEDAAPAPAELSTLTDIEQPTLHTAKSAPDNAHKQSDQQQQAQRARSDPTGAKPPLKQRQRDTLTEDQRQTLQHLEALTKVMDNAVTIPVIGKKVGLDALIGLVPYVGDMAGATVGTYIITRALKYHMPKRLVFRMMVNQAIDSTIGVIPFIGDLFDFGFKANTRNMKLLQDHLERPKQAKRADTCYLFLMFFLVVVVPLVLVVGVIAAIVLGVLAAFNKL